MKKTPNAQFNFADPDSLAVRVATKVRQDLFRMFIAEMQPAMTDYILDVGVTSDQSYSSSNYFEALYPYKDRVVAVGLQNASFLEKLYPGIRYVRANALHMPFSDCTFDFVHSSAVLEHVGSVANQTRMIFEALRVARRGICLTTPNRWFPIEFHTQLPLVHWLPKKTCRQIFRKLGFIDLAEEQSLNLMTASELEKITKTFTGWRFKLATARLLGWPSNLVLFAHRETAHDLTRAAT
jgi:ubiquinone/menaquinone biosynthesis C-methylase UbiE